MLQQTGRLHEADALYRSLLQKYPKDFDLLHDLGTVQGQLGNFPAAVDLISQAIAVNPDNAAARSNHGNALKGLGRNEEALASYDAALNLNPNDADALSNRGATLRDLGRLQEARGSYERALAINPGHVLALDNLGVICRDLRRFDDALAFHDKALTILPNYAPAHHHRGMVLTDLKQYANACVDFKRSIALNPDNIDALNSLGSALAELRLYDDALACYDRALALQPDDLVALCNRGAALASLKRHDDALASFDRVLNLQPNSTEALVNKGTTLRELKRNREALDALDKALAIAPDHAIAHQNRGILLGDLNQHEDALTSYDRSLALDSSDPDTHCNRGITLNALERYQEALGSFQNALLLQPASVPALTGLSATYRALKRQEDAMEAVKQALEIEPDNGTAHYNLAVLRGDLLQYEAALAGYDRALALQPNHADAHNNRGVILGQLRRSEEALASHGRALALDPEHRPALYSRGFLLLYLKKTELAIADFEKLVALQPDYAFALSQLLRAKMSNCDWGGLSDLLSDIIKGTEQGKKLAEPFCCLAIATSAAFLKRSAEIYAADKFPPAEYKPLRLKSRIGGKIRLGYVAGEFRRHATSFLMIELFERHDTGRFEVFAFDNGWDDKSDIRKRLDRCFSEIVDISRLSEKAAATKIRDMQIDILVDLNGHVGAGRTGLFGYRPAPIQVNWLGYPGTIGVNYIDYIIGDASVIPIGHDIHYTEKVVRLPDTYQPNDAKREIASRTPTRAEVNLPKDGFVFCCFNNNHKILPDIFAIWMRLLGRVEKSVLWLLEDDPAVSRNLRSEAAARGIAPDRLVFAPRMTLPDHLARHRLADLFLDTLPYNAHTTASDALWAGLPLVTCMGSTFPGRVAGSLLRAVGLPELITETLAEYEALALNLATTPALLSHLRNKLASNRTTHPLFDSARFRKHIESAYLTMYERWSRGEAPECFAVDPLD